MKVGSLFSGTGMLDEGVRAVLGGDVAWHAEIDPAACRVLAHRYPGVPNLGDVSTVDWASVEPVDVLTGGSPCQDLSHAGKRAGMTKGTRSNLWVVMREAIAALRPGLVVWENVRGAYSACADSEMGRCPRCVDPDSAAGHAPLLRALGRVVGDLADLGYVGRFHGLRAADVGAPHGRFRVFIAATDADRRLPRPLNGHGGGEGGQSGLLRSRQHGAVTADAANVGHERGRPARDGRPGPTDSRVAPADTDVARLEGHGRLHAPPREGEAPAHRRDAPTATDRAGRAGRETRSGRRGTKDGGRLQSVVGSSPAGDGLVQVDQLDMVGVHVVGDRVSVGRPVAPDESGADSVESGTHGGLNIRQGTVGGGSGEDGESCHGPKHDGRPQGVNKPAERVSWGPYEPAIRRWEAVLGRRAPAPTEPGPRGGQRLSPRLTEWMMGWPDGWVTDVPGVTRNDALKLCGNGVVPQQAAEALRRMLTAIEAAA